MILTCVITLFILDRIVPKWDTFVVSDTIEAEIKAESIEPIWSTASSDSQYLSNTTSSDSTYPANPTSSDRTYLSNSTSSIAVSSSSTEDLGSTSNPPTIKNPSTSSPIYETTMNVAGTVSDLLRSRIKMTLTSIIQSKEPISTTVSEEEVPIPRLASTSIMENQEVVSSFSTGTITHGSEIVTDLTIQPPGNTFSTTVFEGKNAEVSSRTNKEIVSSTVGTLVSTFSVPIMYSSSSIQSQPSASSPSTTKLPLDTPILGYATQSQRPSTEYITGHDVTSSIKKSTSSSMPTISGSIQSIDTSTETYKSNSLTEDSLSFPMKTSPGNILLTKVFTEEYSNKNQSTLNSLGMNSSTEESMFPDPSSFTTSPLQSLQTTNQTNLSSFIEDSTTSTTPTSLETTTHTYNLTSVSLEKGFSTSNIVGMTNFTQASASSTFGYETQSQRPSTEYLAGHDVTSFIENSTSSSMPTISGGIPSIDTSTETYKSNSLTEDSLSFPMKTSPGNILLTKLFTEEYSNKNHSTLNSLGMNSSTEESMLPDPSSFTTSPLQSLQSTNQKNLSPFIEDSTTSAPPTSLETTSDTYNLTSVSSEKGFLTSNIVGMTNYTQASASSTSNMPSSTVSSSTTYGSNLDAPSLSSLPPIIEVFEFNTSATPKMTTSLTSQPLTSTIPKITVPGQPSASPSAANIPVRDSSSTMSEGIPSSTTSTVSSFLSTTSISSVTEVSPLSASLSYKTTKDVIPTISASLGITTPPSTTLNFQSQTWDVSSKGRSDSTLAPSTLSVTTLHSQLSTVPSSSSTSLPNSEIRSTAITKLPSTSSILNEQIIQIVFQNEVWTADYANVSSILFKEKVYDLQEALMNRLILFNISSATIFDLRPGSIVANTSLKFYKYVPLCDLSSSIEINLLGSTVTCNASAERLPTWAVCLICILGFLIFNILGLFILAVLWWRHRSKTHGIYDVELCEKKNGWIYPYRYMIFQKSRL